MFPILVDISRVSLALVGSGAAAERRLAQLDEAGAKHVLVFSPAPSDGLARAAGERLIRRLPAASDIASMQLVFLADLEAESARRLAELARSARVLVHVEDRPDLTDIHMPAQIRRGDLLITVSTGGRSPGLAARVRRMIESLFGPEWQQRTREIGTLRRRWRAAGFTGAALKRKTEAWLDRQGWLR